MQNANNLTTPPVPFFCLRFRTVSFQKVVKLKEFEIRVDRWDLISYGNDVENTRVYLKFNNKPADETITVLKKNAFKWSPKNQRWQRQTTANGVNGLKKVLATYEIETNEI